MLSTDDVKHIALLARIGLHDDEVAGYQKDLSAVVDFFHELEKLDTSAVMPIGHITGRANVMRTDEAEAFQNTGRDQILTNAPDTKEGFLKVKSVF